MRYHVHERRGIECVSHASSGMRMIDPQTIITQARVGEVPADWEVFHGERPRPLAMGCFLFVIVLGILTLCSACATIPTLVVFNIRHSQFDFGSFLHIAVPVGLAIALLVGILAYMRTRREAKDPQPLLVVTPEGFVEYFLARHPIKAVSFAELETIIVDLDARIRPNLTLKKLRLRLELHYPGGKVERWRPKGVYDVPEELISGSIMFAYTEYTEPERAARELPKLLRSKRTRKPRKSRKR